jgi:hypothetical protein
MSQKDRMSDDIANPMENFCEEEESIVKYHEYSVKPLAYYFVYDHKTRVEFKKYTIDTLGVVRNKKTDKVLAYTLNGGYYMTSVCGDDGIRHMIFIHRAVTSTFLGAPSTSEHTTDHKESKQKMNNALPNLQWLYPSGQAKNQIRPETYKSAFAIVKDGDEKAAKTAKEWVAHLAGKSNHMKREYTEDKIRNYAREKQHGFAYKEYPDLEGEGWKLIEGTKTKRGHWEISDMNRVKYVTTHAANVLSGITLGRNLGYPTISINGKNWGCHILAFRAFHPILWNAKQDNEMVLHKDDDKEDFRPHMLYLGTQSINAKDAHDNGKHDGKKTARMKCASYVDGVLEKKHISQADAVEYLKSKGHAKATESSICMALSGDRKTAYGRTWIKIE